MDLSELIESIDIVEFLSLYVDLKQNGDEWWGLSCFKEEKTPSFSVRRDPPCFFDYSSGIGGNVFTFVRYFYHCSATEAVEFLRNYVGVDGKNSENATPRRKMSAVQICKRFSAPKSTRKASEKTVLTDSHMDRYEKRDDKLEVWRREGISDDVLDRFQVRYDAFSDRLVYPIRSTEGKIVNVGGRTLDPNWKEKGLKKYCYFYNWGTLDTIYGLSENLEAVKKHKEIILFEGCKSVLIAATWGIDNTGAILTSHLNPNQMLILAKLGVRVVFALDKDVDILKDHNIKKLRHYVPVEYIKDEHGLLDDKDSPVDKGQETFQKLFEGRVFYS